MEDRCKVIIKDVVESHQDYSEYTPGKDGFKSRIETRDDFDSARQPGKEYHNYTVEGVLLNNDGSSKGWFGWDIIAGEFYLDDLK